MPAWYDSANHPVLSRMSSRLVVIVPAALIKYRLYLFVGADVLRTASSACVPTTVTAQSWGDASTDDTVIGVLLIVLRTSAGSITTSFTLPPSW